MAMAWRTRALFALASCALLHFASCRPLEESSCKLSRETSLRKEWNADLCRLKLSFELWTLMKAEGLAQNSDAQFFRENCVHTMEVGRIELITREGYNMSTRLAAAPGHVVSETQHAIAYAGAEAVTFEAFCADENVLSVERVVVQVDSYRTANRRPERRLQSTTSEAGQAHQVAELIAGLEDLGCTKTTGEDQTVCVMSNSFNARGGAEDLQASGDLPEVEVVKDNFEDNPSDEGSAMIEIMYDIAPGSNYKFNTAFVGRQAFADDIRLLAAEQGCDVIVDDVTYTASVAFRDGVLAAAVDEAVGLGSLYFSSAGNRGNGYRFMSKFECTNEFDTILDGTTACGDGVPSHVFQPGATDRTRYWHTFDATDDYEFLTVSWDADVEEAGDVELVLWAEDVSTGVVSYFDTGDAISDGRAVEYIGITSDSLDVRYHLQMVHREEKVNDIEADFLLVSSEGISGQTDGSVFGQPCASKAITVAAMDWDEGDGAEGAFEDPEKGTVRDYSSRGPCMVDDRLKPTTTAADGVSTSTEGFESFLGTSASAPAAAAIATIIRAACFPKVVGYDEIMEMLTNYDYTIDYTNDADGDPETWGTEAGHGIISASQMLQWVESNCSQSCSDARTPPSPSTPADSVCPNADGIPGIENPEDLMSEGHVCCLADCGGCGGVGCSTRTGSATATNCCISDITTTGSACSDTNEAPCFITAGTESTCSNGFIGVEGADSGGDRACCPLTCKNADDEAQCGGPECGSRDGGRAGCCIGYINDEGDDCDTAGKAPCFIPGDDDDSPLGQSTGEAGNADANEQSNGAASASSSSFSGIAGFFSLSVVLNILDMAWTRMSFLVK